MLSPFRFITCRWFRFSLRTLLAAVTAACVWLSWQVSIVQDRRRTIAAIEAARPGGIIYFEQRDWKQLRAHVPFWRNWLGDKAVAEIWLPKLPWPNDLDVDGLFPELAFGKALPGVCGPPFALDAIKRRTDQFCLRAMFWTVAFGAVACSAGPPVSALVRGRRRRANS